jgi:hypothetical protein
MAAELPAPELLPDLLGAFDRLFEDPVKRDPQYWCKNAIARALKDLGHRESPAFLRGAVHVQMEPIWGRQEDSAGPLRGICLLALPGWPDLPRAQVLRHMVNTLTEPSPTVRADAARALAEMQGGEGALLLRLKARTSDAEPAVAGQVLESLLALERRAALPLVRQFLAAAGQVAEEALSPFLQDSLIPYNMPVYPGALPLSPSIGHDTIFGLETATSHQRRRRGPVDCLWIAGVGSNEQKKRRRWTS